MSQDTISTRTNSRPFIVRLLIAFFKLVFWAALIGGVVGGGLFLFQQIQSLRATVFQQKAQMDLLRSDVNSYVLDEQYDARVPLLEQKVETLSTKLTTADSDLQTVTTQLRTQDNVLGSLETQATTAETLFTDLSTNLETISTTVADLQATVEENSGDISTMDATLRSLNSRSLLMDGYIEELQSGATADTAALATMRVWSLIMRARLNIAENDLRDAQADIKRAQTAVNALLEAGPAELAEVMTAVQEQLAEASAVVLTDADAANASLEEAWTALDDTISTLLGYADIEAEIGSSSDG